MVGDLVFLCYMWLIKLYNENIRNLRKWYLNKRFCLVRVVLEYVYGMLKGRWRIFYKKIECKLKNIRYVIMVCIVLYNICIVRDNLCRFRWRLDIEKLYFIRNRGSVE